MCLELTANSFNDIGCMENNSLSLYPSYGSKGSSSLSVNRMQPIFFFSKFLNKFISWGVNLAVLEKIK
jgi:hypothetical protein